jgi:hypothetical protein
MNPPLAVAATDGLVWSFRRISLLTTKEAPMAFPKPSRSWAKTFYPVPLPSLSDHTATKPPFVRAVITGLEAEPEKSVNSGLYTSILITMLR